MNIWTWLLASWGHLATGGVAIIGAFGVGSWISATISGRYQTKNAIRTMRSEWISDLREDLASFAGYAHKFDDMRRRQKEAPPESERAHKLADDVAELRSQKNRMAHQVIMRLNPFEDDHIKLTMIVRDMNTRDSIKYRSLFRAQAQKVLRREWDVVNKGRMTERSQVKWEATWEKKEAERRTKYRRFREELRRRR